MTCFGHAKTATTVFARQRTCASHFDVMKKLSIDCDCVTPHTAPTMNNIGIQAFLDPVASDQSCMGLVFAAPDGKDLITRMESRNGIHAPEHAEAIGSGTRNYKLVR